MGIQQTSASDVISSIKAEERVRVPLTKEVRLLHQSLPRGEKVLSRSELEVLAALEPEIKWGKITYTLKEATDKWSPEHRQALNDLVIDGLLLVADGGGGDHYMPSRVAAEGTYDVQNHTLQ
mgnify:CR=1 FL=1|jgi:hypothetical protein